ncbi:PepSY domain-containing protein [Brevundimonas sp.]|uniref:PepSY domain-containing protein n=1 Tax=Brevundimonas sp. TaxID=1871086 RepID=UPI0025E4910C|nr:PepSY domain-containing protein [Brevundimonas sp.]
MSPSARLNRISTWLHKWIGLVVAVQVVFWVLGGLIMVALPIERVRGEHRAAELEPAALDVASAVSLDQAVAAAGGQAIQATLAATPRGAVWTVTPPEGAPVRLSAGSGRPLPPMEPDEASRLAALQYAGPGQPVGSELLPQAPRETGREGPLWRVDFDDPESTRFYLDPETGAVVSRRSDLWSFFDLMWRLHILDFDTGENINSWWLLLIAGVTVVLVVTGLILLWIRIGRDIQARRRRVSASEDAAAAP